MLTQQAFRFDLDGAIRIRAHTHIPWPEQLLEFVARITALGALAKALNWSSEACSERVENTIMNGKQRHYFALFFIWSMVFIPMSLSHTIAFIHLAMSKDVGCSSITIRAHIISKSYHSLC